MAQQTKKTKIASSTKNPMMQSDSLCVLNTCHMPNVLHSPPGGDEPGHSGDVAVHSVCVWGVHQWTRSPVPRLQTSQRLTPPPLVKRPPKCDTNSPYDVSATQETPRLSCVGPTSKRFFPLLLPKKKLQQENVAMGAEKAFSARSSISKKIYFKEFSF